jgi:transcriptional regulator with XRE-family HTH domain
MRNLPPAYLDLLNRLIERRRQLGIPQAVLDDVLGTSDRYIAKIEAGMKVMQPALLCDLADALGVDLVAAIRGDEPRALRLMREKGLGISTLPRRRRRRG